MAPQITSRQLKKHWETRKEFGGYSGSFRERAWATEAMAKARRNRWGV